MANTEFSATVRATEPVVGGSALLVAADVAAATAVTDTTTADNDVGTVQTDLATTLTDIDTFAASVIAITGGTYTAHQFSTGVSTGLTAAQCNTVFAALNTAITAHLASQTATTTAKAATVAAKTAAATVKLATAAPIAVDVLWSINGATVVTRSTLTKVSLALFRLVAGDSFLTP